VSNFVDFQDNGTPPSPGNASTTRMARVGGQMQISADGAGFQPFPPADWRDIWQLFLSAKVGALPARWSCPWSSDFVGSLDYQQGLGGGTNTDTAGTSAPGVRLMTLTGATGGAFVNIANASGAAAIPDIRLSRWAAVARLRLPTTPPDANTRITFTVSNFGNNANYGVGSIGAISTSFLTSINGGNVTTFPAGTDLSTKAADPNNFVWLYIYNDLTNLKFNVDGEPADKIICATSTITAGSGGYVKVGNFPVGGVRIETCELDKIAVFTEL